jgi:catechol 2,3-dioxygenase-like lactoylglutathione lyase family enzyme
MMKLEHTGLVVKDLDKQVAFYRDVVGLKVMRETEAIALPGGGHTGLDGARRKLVFLGDDYGEHQLELIYYIDPASPAGNPLDHHQVGSIHLCFNTGNIQEFYENLLHQGFCFSRRRGSRARAPFACVMHRTRKGTGLNSKKI